MLSKSGTKNLDSTLEYIHTKIKAAKQKYLTESVLDFISYIISLQNKNLNKLSYFDKIHITKKPKYYRKRIIFCSHNYKIFKVKFKNVLALIYKEYKLIYKTFLYGKLSNCKLSLLALLIPLNYAAFRHKQLDFHPFLKILNLRYLSPYHIALL